MQLDEMERSEHIAESEDGRDRCVSKSREYYNSIL